MAAVLQPAVPRYSRARGIFPSPAPRYHRLAYPHITKKIRVSVFGIYATGCRTLYHDQSKQGQGTKFKQVRTNRRPCTASVQPQAATLLRLRRRCRSSASWPPQRRIQTQYLPHPTRLRYHHRYQVQRPFSILPESPSCTSGLPAVISVDRRQVRPVLVHVCDTPG